MQIRILIALILLALMRPAVGQPALANLQSDYASVEISPAYQEIALGDVAAFTVFASSSLGGAVSVSVPPGLDLLGSPTCSSGCRAPMVSAGAEGTSIEFNIDGQVATLGFTVIASQSVAAGSSLYLNAYLVGGPQAVEQSSATIVVTAASSTQSPPLPDDNRAVYLDVSPGNLRISPEGKVLYRIQPVQWGMWSGQSPDIELDINVPAGLTTSSEPSCGLGDSIPEQGLCESIASEGSALGTTWTVSPGYSRLDGSANGVYMMLDANGDVEPGTSLRISVSAAVDDDTLAEKPPYWVSSTIVVVSPDALLTTLSTPDTVGAILEAKQGYTTSGSTCSATPSSSQVGLYEFGLVERFATTTVGTGQLGMATDGSSTEVCLLPVVFSDVPPRDLYVLATAGVDEVPCRACVYGLITTTVGAEVVFPAQQ